MAKLNTQDFDLFVNGNPAIAFTEEDQTWTISAGVLVLSSDEDGVDSQHGGSSLFNNGAILSDARDGSAVDFIGDTILISNAAGASIVGADHGVVVDGNIAMIDNRGSILGLTGVGVSFDSDSNHVTMNNSGSIFGRYDGIRAISGHDGGVIHNGGLINSNRDGIEIHTAPGLTTVVDNAAGGRIRGGTVAVEVTEGRIALNNHGTVVGTIDADSDRSEADVIVNHGKIVGEVFLGKGDDVFTGTGGTSGDVFGGDGNDRLSGGNAADKLYGNDGNDRLIGGSGNDTLDGGAGFDTLIGGAGRDRFVFQSDLGSGPHLDRITDFTANVDKIVLEENVFRGIGHAGVLAAGFFHVGAAAHDANDHIIYDPNDGFLFFDADGKGGVAEVHFASLAPHLGLHNTDFLVAALLVM